MKKEYVVYEISAAPDGGPYVLISLTGTRELRSSSQRNISPQFMGFTSMEDLMKNLQRTFSGLSNQMMNGGLTVVKFDIREYEESGLKVGDKVYLEISKVQEQDV